MTRAATILAVFARDFAVPYLRGGKCVIGDPLGDDGYLAVRHGLTIDTALADACDEQLVQAAMLVDVTPAPFDEDAATLLYAAHDLFASCHPQAASFYARAHSFCRAAQARVNALPHAATPAVLVTRHLVVERAFLATRTDVHVKWWTGEARFYGDEPPARLLGWPSVRRVKSERKTQPLWRIGVTGGDEETRNARSALVQALLAASPLTRLALLSDPLTKQLGFSLLTSQRAHGKRVSPLDPLEDARLARAVVDLLLARGVDGAGPTLAVALLQAMRESGCPPLVLRRAAELCTHLALMMCLVEAEAPGAQEAAALRALFDEDLLTMNDAARIYWAVVAATLALDGESLVVPSAADVTPAVGTLFTRLRERVQHRRIQTVAEPLVRELQRRLPAAVPAPLPVPTS